MNGNKQRALMLLKNFAEEFEYIATSPLKAKFQLILIMVYVDIFSRIWSTYVLDNSKQENQKERFSTWCDSFIFCSQNRFYDRNKSEFSGLNGNIFYEIRNALLHFGGLPNVDNVSIFVSTESRSQFFDKYPQLIGKRDIVILSPGKLFVAVAMAIANAMEDVLSSLNANPNKENDLIQDIYERIQKESAMPIVAPKSKLSH